MGKRPTVITVMAILGIIWAAINLLSLCSSPLLILAQWNSNTPTAKIYHEPAFLAVTVISGLIALPLNLLLLLASIKSLTLRAWARRGMITYAWTFIAYSILGTLVNILYIAPKTNEAVLAGLPPGGPDMRTLLMVGQIAGVCFMVVFMAFPICIIYFFTRLKVIDAFNGIFPAAPTDFPVEYHNPPQSNEPPPGQ